MNKWRKNRWRNDSKEEEREAKEWYGGSDCNDVLMLYIDWRRADLRVKELEKLVPAPPERRHD